MFWGGSTLHGVVHVINERLLRVDDLERYPKRKIRAVHHCAGNPMELTVPTRTIANVEWSGVLLRDILAEAAVDELCTHLWAFGLDFGSFANVEQEHPERTGHFRMCCRAMDADGKSQPLDSARNAVHIVDVMLSRLNRYFYARSSPTSCSHKELAKRLPDGQTANL